MENVASKKRNSNFELLRIVAMLMIISLHYISENNLSSINGNMTMNNIIFLFIYITTLVCVNSFILISGYHLIHGKFKIQKVVRLWGLALFYSLGIYIICLMLNHEVLKEMTVFWKMRIFSPMLNANFWFLVPYLGLYVIAPFLNKMIKSFNQKQFKAILIIFFVLLCVLQNVTAFLDVFEARDGRSLIYFMFLYGVGAYIRLYHSEKQQKKTEKYKYLTVYFISCLLTFIIKIILELFKGTNPVIACFSNRLFALNAVLVFTASVALFMFFKEINIKNKVINTIITAISPNVLAVFLIHSHILSEKIIWRTNFNVHVANSQNYILHYMISVLLIFSVCILIEQIRRWIFKLVLKIPPLTKLQNKVHEKYEKINIKVNKFIPNT